MLSLASSSMDLETVAVEPPPEPDVPFFPVLLGVLPVLELTFVYTVPLLVIPLAPVTSPGMSYRT